jgi:hypothetical protein
MDDWFRRLPEELGYAFAWWLLLYSAERAYQRLKRLEGSYDKNIRVAITDSVGVSDATTHALRGTVQGGGSMSGELSVGLPKKRSAAEEIFWWYWRIRLS